MANRCGIFLYSRGYTPNDLYRKCSGVLVMPKSITDVAIERYEKAQIEIERLKELMSGRAAENPGHPFWQTASREELLDLARFQSGTTKALQAELDEIYPDKADAERWRKHAPAFLRAICLTRDYVGEDVLPALPGWEWYDTGKAIAEETPEDEWAQQFMLRIDAARGNDV